MDEEVKKAYKEAHELEPLFSVPIEALNSLEVLYDKPLKLNMLEAWDDGDKDFSVIDLGAMLGISMLRGWYCLVLSFVVGLGLFSFDQASVFLAVA
ncbi:hypothetical protein P8452_21617 [Trifolium repens]|nr:hypothetical protein P8452_21617 [Trifolium repens]